MLTPTLEDAHHRTAIAIADVYRRLTPVYDVVYGIGLEHGRRCAMRRLAPQAGERILEVGVGTGLSARDYPEPAVSPPSISRRRCSSAPARVLPDVA